MNKKILLLIAVLFSVFPININASSTIEEIIVSNKEVNEYGVVTETVDVYITTKETSGYKLDNSVKFKINAAPNHDWVNISNVESTTFFTTSIDENDSEVVVSEYNRTSTYNLLEGEQINTARFTLTYDEDDYNQAYSSLALTEDQGSTMSTSIQVMSNESDLETEEDEDETDKDLENPQTGLMLPTISLLILLITSGVIYCSYGKKTIFIK